MSSWRLTSSICKCPEKVKPRSRRVLTSSHGNGEKCGPLSGTIPCTVKCAHECTQHEFGYNCENQHCKVGPWEVADHEMKKAYGDRYDDKLRRRLLETKWYPCKDKDCIKKDHYNVIATTESKTIKYERKRKIVVPRKGNGNPCPNLTEMKSCIYKACTNIITQGFKAIAKWFG